MNSIVAAIRRMKAQIKERLASGQTTAARVESTRRALDMNLAEYAKFQELKSLAVQQEVLTAQEGQTIYRLLGSTPEHFNAQDAATKSVLTQLFKELLDARVRALKAQEGDPS